MLLLASRARGLRNVGRPCTVGILYGGYTGYKEPGVRALRRAGGTPSTRGENHRSEGERSQGSS